MNSPKLSPHLALRIGLAARALPGIDLAQFMDMLIDELGVPLTEEKFAKLNVGCLRSAANALLSGVARADLRQALNYLLGHTAISIVDEAPPPLVPYEDGDMPDSLRLAVASDFGERIDGSFSGCAVFLVYQVSTSEIRLIDRRTPAAEPHKSARNQRRASLINDCHLLYARTLSNPARACLMANGIHPVGFPEGGQAREKITALQAVLAGQPAPWLLRAMGNTLALPPRLGKNGPVLIHSRESTSALPC